MGWWRVVEGEQGIVEIGWGKGGSRVGEEPPPDWARPVGAALDRLGEDPGADFGFAVEVAATPFQWRVWEALRSIPPGETRTYGELAEALGMPRGARAVGKAVAANRHALVIPCHRVVPASGGTGGYRWGSERKREILEREGRTGQDRDAGSRRGRMPGPSGGPP